MKNIFNWKDFQRAVRHLKTTERANGCIQYGMHRFPLDHRSETVLVSALDRSSKSTRALLAPFSGLKSS